MKKLDKVFEKVTLFDQAVQGKTVNHKDDYTVATSKSFQDAKDSFRRLIITPNTFNGTRDFRQREESLKGHISSGLGSAQSDSLVADPVKVDETVMSYIHKKQSKELKRIQERHKVNIHWHKSFVTFYPGNGIQAQFAQEQFITLYQKIATGLQIRTYACNSRIVAFCDKEFPDLLINTTDGKQMTLTGSFISLEIFETHLNGSAHKYSRPTMNTHQPLNKTNRYDTPHKQSVKQEKPTDQAKDETCPICFEPIKTHESTVLPKCKHIFCKDCLKQAFQVKPACPICGEIYGNLTGTQPKGGTMMVSTDRSSLPGYERYGTIVISYNIPSGIQGDEHPNPGTMYQGVSRIAYLPDSPEGNHVLKLLKRAFDQRLTFTIGRSSTTGRNNVVTWNDIHHKTYRDGGPTYYGYPDPEYLNRVQDELKAKGIY